MNHLLESIGRTVFRTLFANFEAGAELNQTEWGPIPKGWQVDSLGEWLSVIETGSRPTGGVKNIRSGIPSIGAENVIGLGKYDYAATKYVPREFHSSMRRGRLEDYDVLLYKDGGKPGQFEPHVSLVGDGFPFNTMCINEHVYRLRARPPISQPYLYFWLTSPLVMEEMRRRGTGVAIPGLNSTAVKELPLLVPSRDRLERFDQIAQPLVARVLLNALGE
jgi:type I restriction enzyme S subunit